MMYQIVLCSIEILGFCHSPVYIRASARAGVSGSERERVGVSGSVWECAGIDADRHTCQPVKLKILKIRFS